MTQPAAAGAGPVVGPTQVRFRVLDPDASLQEVRLDQEVRRPRVWPGFARVAATATWELDFPRPAVDRMEYQLQLRYPGAGPVLVPDPANPLRASGPFGEKSVVEFPGYRPPAWLAGEGDRPPTPPRTTGLAVPSRVLGARVPVQLWRSPGGPARRGERLPLLVVHDGPEYARYAALLQFLDWATAGGRLPPMRAALLAPVDRNEHYSASPAWSRALVSEVLPAIQALAPTPPGRRFLVGMGASLGALAVLAAARTAPASFGGLFLQSGSFFRPGVDDLERHFPRYRRICRFVDDLAAGRGPSEPATAVLTCGTVEENLHGNRVVHAALAAAGWQVTLAEHRDAHNWVAWRDTVDPWLLGLLQELWKGRA